jgi:hypothetical protein
MINRGETFINTLYKEVPMEESLHGIFITSQQQGCNLHVPLLCSITSTAEGFFRSRGHWLLSAAADGLPIVAREILKSK